MERESSQHSESAAEAAHDDDDRAAAPRGGGNAATAEALVGGEHGGSAPAKSKWTRGTKNKIDAKGFSSEFSVKYGPLALSYSVGCKIPEETPPEERAIKVAELERSIDVDAAKIAQGITALEITAPKTAIPLEGYPDLIVEANASALAGGIDIDSDGDFKLEMKALAVGIKVSGTILEGALKTTWNIKGTLELGPEEVARLYKALRTNKSIAEAMNAAARARKDQRFASWNIARLTKQLREANPKQRKRLLDLIRKHERTFASATNKLKQLGTKLATQLHILEGLGQALKHKAGHLASKIASKAAMKVAKKVLARLIPGVGWALAAMDLCELATELHRVLSAESLVWGDPDQAGKGGGSDGETGGGDADDGGTTGDSEPTTGDAEPDVTGEGGPDGGADSGTEPLAEPMPAIAAHTQRVLDVLPGGTRSAMDAADIETLNVLIPKDLTDDELTQLIARLADKGTPSEPMAAIGRIRREIDAIRSGEDTPRFLLGGKDRTDLVDADAGAGGDKEPGAAGGTKDDASGSHTGGDAARDDGDRADAADGATTDQDEGGGDESGHSLDGDTVPEGLQLVLGDPRRLFDVEDGTLVWKPGARAAAKKVYRAQGDLGLKVLDMELVGQEQLDGKPLRATVEVEVIEVIASSKAERATHGKWRTLGESWTQRFELDFRRDDQAIEELVSARELAALVEYDGATKTWSVKPSSTVEVGNATLAIVGTDMTDGGHGKNDSGESYDTFSLIAVPTKVGTPPTAVVTSAGLETLLVGVPVKLPVLVQRPPEPDATTAPAE